MESLSTAEAFRVRDLCGTPAFVYDLDVLRQRIALLQSLPNAYGFTLRFAMKSNPSIAVMTCIRDAGVHIDASSVYEVRRALRYGFEAHRIQLTSQNPAKDADLKELIFEKGCLYNACSLLQLENFCRVAAEWNDSMQSKQARVRHPVTVRVNPGLGSGSTSRTNVGGPGSSFGIWHEHLASVIDLAHRHTADVVLSGLHSHIGSGTDATVWERAASLTLAIAGQLPEVTTVSLGGGFKVDRMRPKGDSGLDMTALAQGVKAKFEEFYHASKRQLRLELEPGTFFVAMSGFLITSVIDVVDTKGSSGSTGFVFAKLDGGMNEVLRPSLYGAQHPIAVLRAAESAAPPTGTTEEPIVFVGPCCESGDILTPAPGDPEGLLPRSVPGGRPRPGDLAIVGGCGAYCSAMATANYNSYPAAPETAIWTRGTERTLSVVRARQTFEQVLETEVRSFSL